MRQFIYRANQVVARTAAMQPLVCYVLALLLLLAPGCVSQRKARAQAAAAYKAGQQEALARQAQADPNTVRINGQVRQPVLPWTPAMTLGSALVAAEYFGPDPRSIYIVRQGRAIEVDPKELLSGKDLPLLAGDIIQIQTTR